MQPTYPMDDTQWSKLIQNVAYYFDDLTLKRGFQYYKQNRVQPFTMTEPRKINALVEGREDYRVTIDLDGFTNCHCNCPVSGHCKHMAAVLLNYAEQQNRSVQVLANAKAASFLPKISSTATSTSIGADATRQQQMKEMANHIASGKITEWREYFEFCVSPLAHTTRNPEYVSRALSAINKFKPKMLPETEKLFTLHAHLYLLEKLAKPSTQSVGQAAYAPSLGYYTQVAVSELQEVITGLLKKTLPLSPEQEQDLWPYVIDTLSYLRREMLTESRDRSRDQPSFSLSYDLLWRNWIYPNTGGTKLYLNEIEQLQQAEGELGASLSQHAWLLAQSRMYYYLMDDQKAWDLLNKAAERPGLHPDELMSFTSPLLDAGDWSRLVGWLVQIGPLLSSRLYNLNSYSTSWEEAVRHLPEAELQMWDTLATMLPISGEVYEEKLITYEKWQTWMDYQLSIGKQPSEFRVKDLQPVEKNAPEVLLPFYHQAAERFVLDKNRHSYKAAVKLLKRLSKLYKKLKQEERWEEFLTAFAIRHSRLRALQEELRKGKLIP
ncbi:SWIM zinc finger family protein [Paenibacillus sp. FSL R10-2778]|uniref:SWIM zinc finger family protein n=1 Tax=Paenibacillus sp. FSL R10-2778 TaxID=2954659 RepID=UPI003158A609